MRKSIEGCPADHKRCSKCGKVLHKDLFGFAVSGIYQRRAKCLECSNLEKKAYFAANRKAAIERTRKWRLEHPEAYAAHNEKHSEKWKMLSKDDRKSLYQKYGKRHAIEKVEELSDTYIRNIIARYAVETPSNEAIAKRRDEILFKRELRKNGFSKCYSILTRLPLKLHWAIPEGRQLKQRTGIRTHKQCPHCKRYLPTEVFGFRKNSSTAYNSLCPDCKVAIAKEASESMSNDYIRSLIRRSLKDFGVSKEEISDDLVIAQRMVLTVKRKRVLNEERS